MKYACHYCGRTDGQPTKDHKIPKVFGGRGLGSTNIVRCCKMCNVLKCSRHYGMFVAFFGEFLELHGEQYRAKNPDDPDHIRQMSKKFRSWLRAQNAPLYEEQMPRRRDADPEIAVTLLVPVCNQVVDGRSPRVGPPVRSGQEASEQ